MTISQAIRQLRDDLQTWVANNLVLKVDKVDGKGLSTNDYTNSDKNDLATLKSLVGDTSVSEQISKSITIDSALSSTSTNPVQNKVINAALSNYVTEDYLTGDFLNTDEFKASVENVTKSSDNSAYLDMIRVGDTIRTMRDVDERFLACTGQTVYKTTYPELYEAIKSKYTSTAGSASWSSFTESTTLPILHLGDLYFQRVSSSSSYYNYSTDGSTGWTKLPYSGTPYYTDGCYMLDSGYVCSSSSDVSNSNWHKITFNTSDQGYETYTYWEDDEEKTGTAPYSCGNTTFSITDDWVFIHRIWRTDEITTSSYEDVDEEGNTVYSESTGEYYQKSYLIAIKATSLFNSIDETKDGTLLLSTSGTKTTSYYWSEEDFGERATYSGSILGGLEVMYSVNRYMAYGLKNDSPIVYSISSSITSATQLSYNGSHVRLCGEAIVSYNYSTSNYYMTSVNVCVDGKCVTLSPASSTYIYSVGFDSSKNCVIYITNYSNRSGRWSTYCKNIYTNEVTYLCNHPNGKYQNYVMDQDTDGRVYVLSYKLSFTLTEKCTLPSNDSEGDQKYIKVSS